MEITKETAMNTDHTKNPAAVALGKLAAGKPKNFSPEERALRRERIKVARAAKRQRRTCLYCGYILPVRPEQTGDWWKTWDWEAEAKLHSPDCEWVRTKAHTEGSL